MLRTFKDQMLHTPSILGDAISGLEDLRAEDGWGEGMADGSVLELIAI